VTASCDPFTVVPTADGGHVAHSRATDALLSQATTSGTALRSERGSDNTGTGGPEVDCSNDMADALRTALECVQRTERDLVDARSALIEAGAALAAVRSHHERQPDAYTLEQVAELLGLSRSTIAVMVRTGAIRSAKIGGSRRVFRADLDQYIANARLLTS
jgi:excisionase family DNA binding protein